MNDITPPKPNQQQTQKTTTVEATASPSIGSVSKPSRSNVGRPPRFYKKRGFIIGLIVAVILLAVAVGVYAIWSQNKTYKVGNYSFGKKDVAQTQQALRVARGGTEAPGGAAASLKEAEDREVMLAALKSEADKNNITYDTATLDASMTDLYKEYGGKEAYMSYMKTAYSWTPDLVYEYRTIEYLKTKLQDKILMNKSFTAIYVRWDIIKDRDGAKYEASMAARTGELETKYKPFLESGQDFAKLSSQVDVASGATREQTEKAYEQANGTPVILQTENPGDITYSKAVDAKLGIDPQEFFATAKTKGQVIGPKILSDGRIVLARLESTGSGTFANWDDYLVSARNQAGLSGAQSQSFGSSMYRKLAKALDRFNILKPQVAQAALINCASHQVPVNYSFKSVDKNTGAGLTGGLFSASASRNSTVCDMGNYTANGYSVSGSGTWRTVTKTVWGTPGSITLDCVGYDWAFWAPNVSGYTYHSQTKAGTYANGGSISVTFFYTKPVPKPTCTSFSASPSSVVRGSSATLSWDSKDGTSWGISPSIGTIGRFGSRPVNPSSTTTYTFVVTNSSGTDTCSTTVTVTDPPANAPTCTLSASPNSFPSGSGTATLSWSSERGTAWTLPDIGQSPGDSGSKDVSVTSDKTYTYTVTNSSGTATCRAGVYIGEPPVDCTVTDTCPEPAIIKCEVSLAKAPELVRFGIGGRNEISIQPGEPVYAAVRGYNGSGQLTTITSIIFDPGDFVKSTYERDVVYVARPTVTTTYKVLATFPSLESTDCTAKVNVDTPPLAPAYGPWLQSKRGNVLALGYIESQKEGQLGSRLATAIEKEAEYIIMSYMASTPGASNFCSTNKYNFGTVVPPTCSYSAGGSGYMAKVVNKSDIGTLLRDPAVVSLDRAIAARTGLAPDACTAKAPYLVTTLGGATLPASLGANNSCPVIIKSGSTGGLTVINASTISFGRGTLYVNGDLTINGNIDYSYASTYSSVNLIPNLGIVVKGDIIIANTVTKIDASLYATGKVKTCSTYPGGASCNQKLTIRGKLAAANGFELGRNYRTGTGIPASLEPAELIIGSGLVEAFPPPGFVNLTASASDQQVITTEANPRF